MYCPSFSTPTPYSSLQSTCCPPPPCCPPPCPSPCSGGGISKLADFVHYGGRGGTSSCTPPCPPKPCCPPPVQRRCPPLPPCAPTCITQKSNNCKDLPAQRLRNVDVLEELCYYVPGCDPSGAMDCYTVDCCGNVEKISEDSCNPCECPAQPVKYSRRQRFTFNDPGGNRPAYGDPWPFTDNCGGNGGGGGGNRNGGDDYYGGNGGGCGGGRGPGGNRRGSMNNGGNNGGGGGNNGRGIGVMGNSNNCCCNGRKYTYCPEETPDCSEMLPGVSGVYYFDRERRAFVPEKDLPKPPEIIEKQVRVPDIEEYELLEEESAGGVGGGNGGSSTTYNGGNGGGGGGRQTVQPVIQPIIMPSNGQCPQGTQPCQGPPPCGPPPCYPPPCQPPCGPPPCNPYYPPPPCYPPPCNPCQPCCNPCAPQCNPCCMPNCNPMMNMCGGCLPMVIPMCPQQPGGQAMGGGGMGGPMMPPPPPFPFPPPFMMGGPGGSRKKKNKKSKSKKSRRSKRRSGGGTGSRRNTYETVGGGAEAEFTTEGDGVTEHLEGEETEDEGLPGDGGEELDPNAVGAEGSEFSPRGSVQSQIPGQGQVRTSGDQGTTRRSFGSQGQQAVGFQGAPSGGGQRTVTQMDDGTIVTTIDFPPGEAESVDVLATQRRDPNEANIDVVAEIQGGKAGPPPAGGERVAPVGQYSTQDGATVTTYKMPEGKDGYVSAKNL